MNRRTVSVSYWAGLLLFAKLWLSAGVGLAEMTAAEKEALKYLHEQVSSERREGLQASPSWSEACKALGKTRNPELVATLDWCVWREDSRVANELHLERYPALWALAEIGTPALPKLAAEAKACEDARKANVLASAFAKLYGRQRFAESYLRGLEKRTREAGDTKAANNVLRVLMVFRTAG